jgi:hypothetical protein
MASNPGVALRIGKPVCVRAPAHPTPGAEAARAAGAYRLRRFRKRTQRDPAARHAWLRIATFAYRTTR